MVLSVPWPCVSRAFGCGRLGTGVFDGSVALELSVTLGCDGRQFIVVISDALQFDDRSYLPCGSRSGIATGILLHWYIVSVSNARGFYVVSIKLGCDRAVGTVHIVYLVWLLRGSEAFCHSWW